MTDAWALPFAVLARKKGVPTRIYYLNGHANIFLFLWAQKAVRATFLSFFLMALLIDDIF